MVETITTPAGRKITFVEHLDSVRLSIPLKARFSLSALPVENIIEPKAKMGMSLYVAEKDRNEVVEWAGKN